MISIHKVEIKEKKLLHEIVSIHLDTFQGFFLTFMGRGFLNQMYYCYCGHRASDLLVAEEKGKVVGFLAYSSDFSDLYKYMIRTRLIPFAWYSMGAFIRKPSVFMHIVKAFLKPGESKRNEKYVELASIGVDPGFKAKGVGTQLIDELKVLVDFNDFSYIKLETDAVNNNAAIYFYEKNGFVKERIFETDEGRKMYEFRFMGNTEEKK
ncbi:GNAT family N-acetyltransferase [Blautia schinkii]|nr:GNAT family N-acetyltransferase [Blautia schinkii]